MASAYFGGSALDTNAATTRDGAGLFEIRSVPALSATACHSRIADAGYNNRSPIIDHFGSEDPTGAALESDAPWVTG